LSFLRQFYYEDQLETIQIHGLCTSRMALFIAATLIVGGEIAPVTLCVAETIKLAAGVEEADEVIQIFAYGADWNSSDPIPFAQVPNYIRDDHIFKMDKEIESEVLAKRYVSVCPSTVVGISAMGMVDKDHSNFVKVRIVHDLSRPDGSVNSLIDIKNRSFITVHQAAEMVLPKAVMAKIDLSKAYRSIPTAPHHWRLHALQWRNITYIDLRLPFGNRAAPGVFDTITQVLVRTGRRLGINNLMGYIDDFFIVCNE
jgi:hypothetical protein